MITTSTPDETNPKIYNNNIFIGTAVRLNQSNTYTFHYLPELAGTPPKNRTFKLKQPIINTMTVICKRLTQELKDN